MRLMTDAKGNTYKVAEADVKRYDALGYADAGEAKELDSIAGPDDEDVDYDSGQTAESSGANTKPRRRRGGTKPASPQTPESGSAPASGSSVGGSDTTTTTTPAGGTVSSPKPPAP